MFNTTIQVKPLGSMINIPKVVSSLKDKYMSIFKATIKIPSKLLNMHPFLDKDQIDYI